MKKVLSIVMVLVFCVCLCSCGKNKAKSTFDKVEKEVVQLAGQITGGDYEFTVDTYPYDETNMEPALIKMLEDDAREGALEAIRYANEELGFASYVYSDMLETTALMGRQSAENDDYKVSWTYHPDEGLEVTYEVK